MFIKKFIREYNFTFDKFYYHLKINNHKKVILTFEKKIPSYFIKLILKIIFLNLVDATGIFAKLFAYYKFRIKFLGRGGRVV